MLMAQLPNPWPITEETVDEVTLEKLASLSPRELKALVDASLWYAKYHERSITEKADDASALAVARREKFQDLHAGLRKVGARIRSPF
jgi:hypothetical protein